MPKTTIDILKEPHYINKTLENKWYTEEEYKELETKYFKLLKDYNAHDCILDTQEEE